MKQPLTLVIMAAGMGSRFGGLKQIEPVGPHGEFILDYSITDALLAGFNKFVFIIKKENESIFEEKIGSRLRKKAEIVYVYQENEQVPNGYQIPKERVKPLGTGHAIYCVKEAVKENFAVINADDFYGRESFAVLAEFLKKLDNTQKPVKEYAMVGYPVVNTLTEYGTVKRGVCVLAGHYLQELIESSVKRRDDVITASPVDGRKSFEVSKDTFVSMNLFGFSKEIFAELEEEFLDFLEENQTDLSTCEFQLPTALENQMKKGKARVLVLPTSAVWHGVTYREDKEELVKALAILTENGEYR